MVAAMLSAGPLWARPEPDAVAWEAQPSSDEVRRGDAGAAIVVTVSRLLALDLHTAAFAEQVAAVRTMLSVPVGLNMTVDELEEALLRIGATLETAGSLREERVLSQLSNGEVGIVLQHVGSGNVRGLVVAALQEDPTWWVLHDPMASAPRVVSRREVQKRFDKDEVRVILVGRR